VRAARRVRPEDEFMVQPTSGSTGAPKLVRRSHRAFMRYAHYVGQELMPLDANPRFLAVNALTHAFGMHMLATAMALGGELAVPRRLDTAASLEDVRALDPGILPMTPRVLRSLHAQAQERPAFGPSARFLLTAGGRSDPALLRWVADQGIEVIEWYGSSEASLVALTPRGGRREGWAGRVVDDTSVQVAVDGELLVRSPGLMRGYHGDSGGIGEDGYYRTGDLGELSADGFVRILGRKRDVFNTPEGSNVYPERIETMLEALPGVQQVMLVGDQRPFIAAFVVGHLAAADLERINRHLESIERVHRVVHLADAFPTSVYAAAGSAKVRRNRAAFLNHYATQIARLYQGDDMHCHVDYVRRPHDGDPADAAREAAALARAAFSDGDPAAREGAERLLYAIHAYNGFSAPLDPVLSAMWLELVHAKARSLVPEEARKPLPFDELATGLQAAVAEADRRDHALLDTLDGHGLAVYAKNWFTSTHGFEEQLVSTLKRSPYRLQRVLFENLSDELGIEGKPHVVMRSETLRNFGIEYRPDRGGVLEGAFEDPDVATEAFAVANARTVFSLLRDPAYSIGSFYTVEACFQAVCHRVAPVLREHGATEDELHYWGLHDEADAEHSAEFLAGIGLAGLGDDAHARVLAGALSHLRVRSELFAAMARRIAMRVMA
jgi:hypothetical protein